MRGNGRGLVARDLDSGKNMPDSFASFERTDSGELELRTSQASLFEDSRTSLETWPKSGSMRNGRLYERPTSERHIDEPESSSWLTPSRTPEATSNNGSNAGRPATGKSLAKQARGDWPTPRAEDSESPGMRPRETTPSGLTAAARHQWPTPTVMDAAGFEGKPDHGRTSPNSGRTLLGAAKDWPTPQAMDMESAGGRGAIESGRRGDTLSRATERAHPSVLPDSGPPDQANRNTRGSRPVVLNPRWVLALMGFPVDWLDGVALPSKRRVTPSSRSARRSKPVDSAPSSSEACDAAD